MPSAPTAQRRASAKGTARRWLLSAAVLIVIAGLGIGLPSILADDEPDAEVGDIRTVYSSADIVLPLDAFADTPETARTIAIAGDLLGQACMRRLGMDWTIPDRSGPYLPGSNERRYGVVDLRQAEIGYERDPSHDARTERIRSTSEQLSTAALDVWWGKATKVNGSPVPKNGCSGEVRRKLGETPPANVDPRLVEDLAIKSYERSRDDRRVQDALDNWSNCMNAAGHPYSRPWDAPGDPRWRSGANASSPEAVAVARADVTCKQKTNLAGIWLAVDSAHQRILIREHADDLNSIRKWRDTVAAHARTVTAVGAPKQ